MLHFRRSLLPENALYEDVKKEKNRNFIMHQVDPGFGEEGQLPRPKLADVAKLSGEIISCEPISERVKSKSFDEPNVKSIRIDVIGTFWRATSRGLYPYLELCKQSQSLVTGNFNAQICLPPHAKDSFPLISYI